MDYVRDSGLFELFEIPVENFIDKAGFPRAGNTGDADQKAERNFNIDILKIVGASSLDLDGPLQERFTVTVGEWNRFSAAQIGGRERILIFEQRVVRTGKHHAAALLAGLWAEIDDIVGFFDNLGIVLDHDYSILVRS